MTPVTIITGFLGTGKTTLLAGLLRTPRFRRAAVIVNEFGEIGLDHDLLEAGDDRVVTLPNGCLCCRARDGLAATLVDLAARRDSGQALFDRVVIETSGLAEPGSLVRLIAADPLVSGAFAVSAVATTVDATAAGATARTHGEARHQIALADLILLTKTDIATPDDLAATRAAVQSINTVAPVIEGRSWDGSAISASRHTGAEPTCAGHDAAHAETYSTVCILRDDPVPPGALLLFLEALAHLLGDRLLRLKGLVNLERVDRPMVLQGVQHMIHQPELLPRWPSEDRRTRIVLIGRGLSSRWAGMLLDAVIAEMRAVGAEIAARERTGADPLEGEAV